MKTTVKRWPEGKGYKVTVNAYGERLRRQYPNVTKVEAEAMVPVVIEECRVRAEERENGTGLPRKKDRYKFHEAARLYDGERGGGRYEIDLARLVEKFGDWWLDEVKGSHVREWAQEAYPGKPPSQNVRGIALAQAVINCAAGEEWCPKASFRRVKAEPKRRVAVDGAYLVALEKAFRNGGHTKYDGMYELLLTGTMTGCRMDELARMRWEWTDWTDRTTWLPKTKATGEVTIDLPQEVVEAWLAMRKRHMKMGAGNGDGRGGTLGRTTCERMRNELVFGWKDKKSIYQYWRELCNDSGIEYVTPHQVMRHTFATRLHNELGYSANDIAATGRWAAGSISMIQKVYIHSDKTGRQASEDMAKLRAAEREQMKKGKS